ncbi:phosphatidylserine decarboxylase [Aurantiacibacter gangjinensis]|uniref:Phosphatidylserine decarboxylase proenzyme n=1 Tax=Aurantiacibacter gangjinensis TaxID=502682 RepID=A0A0G9MR02_9SPHN|nr:phosphatidylserine decarboxylase [Aurantiacibacter gangjinensis]APE29023.1 Phosphatidylserine decarboxylase [Aurantiacibacter gangjinensis]KLE33125.1 phosphatidylserine decarboxylase [Aurantiacibacter gangjinensis]
MSGELRDNRGRGEAEWGLPAVHPEGRKFGVIAIGVALFFGLVVGWEALGWLLAALSAGIFAFFRDPERVVPQGDNAIVSPADGQVSLIAQVPPPVEMQNAAEDGSPGLGSDPVTRISIFMSVFDVHINRSPIAGTIRRIIYVPGRFMNADLDKASDDNERQHMLVERADGTRIAFTQIAGLVARRIVPFVKPGDIVAAGQRIGLIRFGSRVDIYLPAGTDAKVLLGQRVIAGETILAEIGTTGLLEGVNQ